MSEKSDSISLSGLMLSLAISASIVIYLYYKYIFSFWKRRGIPSLNPVIPFGDITLPVLGRESLFVRMKYLYEQFKKQGYEHGGVYFLHGPVYLTVDVRLAKEVLQTSYEHFYDRGVFYDRVNMPLSYNLFTMNGQEWKILRAKLTPTFTSGKIRNMFEIMREISDTLVERADRVCITKGEIDLKDLLRRFTIDIICSCALGIEAKSLKNDVSDFVKFADRMFNHRFIDLMKILWDEGLTNFGAFIKLMYKDRENLYFLVQLVEKTIEHRRKNKIKRNDLLNTLIELLDDGELSFEDVVCQTFLFFSAGFETSSGTMTYCIHELAHNQAIQDKLRQEIKVAFGTNLENLGYETIQNLEYLDNVVNETLRLYPIVPLIMRICVKDWKVPDAKGTVPEGTPVLIPAYAMQRDPEYFPNPTVFDPDRFKDKTHPPFAFIPFGEGPKVCIGKRFGLLQTKVGLVRLISQFKFEPSETVPRDLTIRPCTTSLALHVVETVCCKISYVQQNMD